jgi:type IV pilus assembly protein PilE
MNLKSLHLNKHRRQVGFTMVEIMLVLAVVAVLTAISVPLYTQHVEKTNRTALKSEMTLIAQKLANFKMINHNYNVTLTTLNGSIVYPSQGDTLYDLALDTVSVPGAWTLTATPRAGSKQANNGVVRLNDQGWQCWTKPPIACTLSSTSKW